MKEETGLRDFLGVLCVLAVKLPIVKYGLKE